MYEPKYGHYNGTNPLLLAFGTHSVRPFSPCLTQTVLSVFAPWILKQHRQKLQHQPSFLRAEIDELFGKCVSSCKLEREALFTNCKNVVGCLAFNRISYNRMKLRYDGNPMSKHQIKDVETDALCRDQISRIWNRVIGLVLSLRFLSDPESAAQRRLRQS